jgi:hypothetical protein
VLASALPSKVTLGPPHWLYGWHPAERGPRSAKAWRCLDFHGFSMGFNGISTGFLWDFYGISMGFYGTWKLNEIYKYGFEIFMDCFVVSFG